MPERSRRVLAGIVLASRDKIRAPNKAMAIIVAIPLLNFLCGGNPVNLSYAIGIGASTLAVSCGHLLKIRTPLVPRISRYTFGLYLVHPLFLGAMIRLLPNELPLAVLMTFALSLAFVRMIRHAGVKSCFRRG